MRAGLGRSPSPKARVQSGHPVAKQSSPGQAFGHERVKAASTGQVQQSDEHRLSSSTSSPKVIRPGVGFVQPPAATTGISSNGAPLAPRGYTPPQVRAAPVAHSAGQGTWGQPAGSAGYPTSAGARPPPQASSRNWVHGAPHGTLSPSRRDHHSPSPIRSCGHPGAVQTAAPSAHRIPRTHSGHEALHAPTTGPQTQPMQPSRSMPSLQNPPGPFRMPRTPSRG